MKRFLLFLTDLIISSCSSNKTENKFDSIFRGNNFHSGIYNSKPIIQLPNLKWKFKTKGAINSSAAVDEKNIYFGSADSNFYCINQSTGELKWKFKTGGVINSTAAVSNGIVYFGS